MIKHIVLLDLPPSYNPAELAAIMVGIDGLRETIQGFVGFQHGPNKDFEGMSMTCAYALICDFADEETSRRYIIDPDHKALGQRLVDLCCSGSEGITVVDLAVTA